MKRLNEESSTFPSLRQNDARGQHSSTTIPHNDASSGQNTTINGIADWTLFFFFSIFFSAHLGTELGMTTAHYDDHDNPRIFAWNAFHVKHLSFLLPPTCTPTYTPRFTHLRFYFAGLHYLSFCLSVGPTL